MHHPIMRLADATRDKLEQFKGYMPILTALCNPGDWQSLLSAF